MQTASHFKLSPLEELNGSIPSERFHPYNLGSAISNVGVELCRTSDLGPDGKNRHLTHETARNQVRSHDRLL